MKRTGKFLVASPTLKGFFNNTVVFIFEETPAGATGLVINRMSGKHLSDLLQQHGINYPNNIDPIHIGGPVNPMSIMMMHTEDFVSSNTLFLDKGVNISSDDLMFEKLVSSQRPDAFKICAGLAQWSPGQLEKEIKIDKAWLVTDLPPRLIWDTKAGSVWQASMDHISKSMFDQYI